MRKRVQLRRKKDVVVVGAPHHEPTCDSGPRDRRSPGPGRGHQISGRQLDLQTPLARAAEDGGVAQHGLIDHDQQRPAKPDWRDTARYVS